MTLIKSEKKRKQRYNNLYKKLNTILKISNISVKYFERLMPEPLKDLTFIKYLNIYIIKRIIHYKFIIKHKILFYKDTLFYKFIKDFEI